MVNISFKRVRDNAVLPAPATELSGGMDVTAAHIEPVSDDEIIVYLGLQMQPPPGYRIRFSPRSSFTGTRWILQNSPALGDADFAGEYRLRFRAIPEVGKVASFFNKGDLYKATYPKFPYKVGERCAQMWVEEILPVEFKEVEEMPNQTDRQGGFGSTGN